jgi:hypothetical protein
MIIGSRGLNVTICHGRSVPNLCCSPPVKPAVVDFGCRSEPASGSLCSTAPYSRSSVAGDLLVEGPHIARRVSRERKTPRGHRSRSCGPDRRLRGDPLRHEHPGAREERRRRRARADGGLQRVSFRHGRPPILHQGGVRREDLARRPRRELPAAPASLANLLSRPVLPLSTQAVERAEGARSVAGPRDRGELPNPA